MNKKKIFFISIYFFIAILSLCGCDNNKKEDKIEQKVASEIDYLDKQIIGIMNKLNNITLENYEVKSREVAKQENSDKNSNEQSESSDSKSESNGKSSDGSQSDNNEKNIKVLQMQPNNILVIDKNDIDWLTIKSEIETMYSSWNTILLDLYKMNIQNEDILNFSQILDNTIITAKDEDKQSTLANLANLYSHIPIYMDKIQTDESKKNIFKTKSNILNAYAWLEQDNWEEIQKQINQADENYAKVTNDIKYIESKQEQASRVYILIKELKNSINMHDKDIFYIKYKNLLNSI